LFWLGVAGFVSGFVFVCLRLLGLFLFCLRVCCVLLVLSAGLFVSSVLALSDLSLSCLVVVLDLFLVRIKTEYKLIKSSGIVQIFVYFS
jgi:hypothetical protein